MFRLLAAAVALYASVAHAAPESVPLTLTPVGSPVKVFGDKDKCEKWDIPDAPARAYRDYQGNAVLFSSHYMTRAMIGPDLANLRHDCDVAFRGRSDPDPGAYDDQVWLTSVFTRDGKTVHALMHNEYQGHTRPQICPAKDYLKCWRNTITYAMSTDGGRTFTQAPHPRRFVVGLPYKYDPDAGGLTGPVNPTNMIEKDGWVYAMYQNNPYKAQKYGVCVMRTRTPEDPASWRGWDGTGYNVRFLDPYRQAIADPSKHVCEPVGRNRLLNTVGSLSYHKPSGWFILILTNGNSEENAGVYAVYSRDLINWTVPKLFWKTSVRTSKKMPQNCKYIDRYLSLMSADPKRVNPNIIEGKAYLFFTREYPDAQCNGTAIRDMMRLSVDITPGS